MCVDVLQSARTRIQDAQDRVTLLMRTAQRVGTEKSVIRLAGKRDGLGLALGYIDELLRELTDPKN